MRDTGGRFMNGRLRDEELAGVLRAVLQGGARPPTDEQRRTMWSKIAAARSMQRNRSTRHSMQWAVSAAAALLAAGIAIGVLIRPSVTHRKTFVASAVASASMAQITADHFAASQQLLMTASAHRAVPNSAASDSELVGRARELLSTTQILLDSPAGVDPNRRRLLSDLELVLVQIVQLASEPLPDDRDLIARAINGRRMIPRLQSAMPPSTTWGT